MIVRETAHAFIMTTQHEHAHLSAQIAEQLPERLFGNHFRNDVLLAIREHDRSWIRLDDTPIWNDRTHAPYSMIDYPLLPKLMLYRVGIDETEQMNAYAGMLCSMHFSSFHAIKTSNADDCVQFMHDERNRQAMIKQRLKLSDEELIQQHLMLLQLCDDLSLYVCMNKPGTDKQHEHPWFRDGFEQKIDHQSIDAHWVDDEHIQLSPFICKQEFTAKVNVKEVPKEAIRSAGIHAAYEDTPLKEQRITFIS